MNKQVKLSDIKGLSFIGGQITSRIEADEKKNERVIGTDKSFQKHLPVFEGGFETFNGKQGNSPFVGGILSFVHIGSSQQSDKLLFVGMPKASPV